MFILKYIFINFLRNRVYTLINLIGLSLGITTFLLLALYVLHEMQYDKQFSDYQDIYRITTKISSQDNSQHIAVAPLPIKSILKNNYPEVKEAAVICEIADRYTIEYNGIQFAQDGFRDASKEIFNVFDYKVILGNLSTALTEPNSVVLTRSLASKIMGDNLNIDKEIFINKEPFKITAIIEDLPKNTDLYFSALIPGYRDTETDWLDLDGFLYVKLQPEITININEILDNIERNYYAPLKDELEGLEITFEPQRLDKIHFSNEILADSPKGNILYVYFFSLAAFIILLVACINYINLSFARLAERNYFSGVCRINGAGKFHTIKYLFLESVIFTLLSLIISVILVLLFLPLFNTITGKDIFVSAIFRQGYWGTIFIVFITVIFAIGGLPLLYSLFVERKKVIQNMVKSKYTRSVNYRGGLVVAQFAFTIILIICLVAFQRQMKFMKNKDLGFSPANIYIIEMPFDTNSQMNVKQFVDGLYDLPGIVRISKVGGGAEPGLYKDGMKMLHAAEIDGKLKQFIVNFCDGDEYYIDLMGIKLINGKNFTINSKANLNKCIINETFAKELGIEDDPLGKTISQGNNVVIGVVKDFHFLSPHNPIEPCCIRYQSDEYTGKIFVKYDHEVLSGLRSHWKKTMPHQPFLFRSLENSYKSQYLKDNNIYSVISFFTLLSIIISCLGLIGLIKYTCEKRVKEIGVRKVCGARTNEILSMINKEFVKWVILAFLVSCPLARIIINKWLESYAYKITVGAWVYALAGIFTLVLSITLVSLLSWLSANKNPVKALRYE